MAMDIAQASMNITSRLCIPYVFKGSYRKANRSRIDSFTGIVDEEALKILRKVRLDMLGGLLTRFASLRQAVNKL